MSSKVSWRHCMNGHAIFRHILCRKKVPNGVHQLSVIVVGWVIVPQKTSLSQSWKLWILHLMTKDVIKDPEMGKLQRSSVLVLHAITSLFFVFNFLAYHMAYGILVPWLGIEPPSPVVEAQNLFFFNCLFIWLHAGSSEVIQSCPTLCGPMNCSLPGSSVHGIFQARILEWVAISFPRRSTES